MAGVSGMPRSPSRVWLMWTGDQREARSKACATLLDQGDHHVEIFVAALAKKLGDVTP